MEEWKEYKLNDICTVVSSKRIFAEQYVNEGIPFYRQKEMNALMENSELCSKMNLFFHFSEEYLPTELSVKWRLHLT